MIHLKTNVWNIIGRLFIVMIIAGLLYSLVLQIISGHKNNDKSVALLYIVAICLLYVLLGCVTTCFGIIKVTIDTSSGVIKLNTLLSQAEISCKDIAGYYSTMYTSSVKTFNGLILKMEDGKSYRLRQQNLQSIPMLTEYLEVNDVKYLGIK
jgi:hypothetical protein